MFYLIPIKNMKLYLNALAFDLCISDKHDAFVEAFQVDHLLRFGQFVSIILKSISRNGKINRYFRRNSSW